jgi:hypothetical protein
MKSFFSLPLLAALIAGGVQLHRPAAMRPVNYDRAGTLEAQAPVPPHVQQLMRRACLDCHSHETRWPWYAQIAPMSWMVGADIDKARQRLNFSEWSSRYGKPGIAASMLAAACADVQSGKMPLARYRMLHPEARLTPAERAQFCEWSMGEAARLSRLRLARKQ